MAGRNLMVCQSGEHGINIIIFFNFCAQIQILFSSILFYMFNLKANAPVHYHPSSSATWHNITIHHPPSTIQHPMPSLLQCHWIMNNAMTLTQQTTYSECQLSCSATIKLSCPIIRIIYNYEKQQIYHYSEWEEGGAIALCFIPLFCHFYMNLCCSHTNLILSSLLPLHLQFSFSFLESGNPITIVSITPASSGAVPSREARRLRF